MEEKESIGELLRRVREEKGIPLDQVVKITKIHETYLRAIEENNKYTLPGDAYYKAFLKSYATCLGLNFDDLKKKYFIEETDEKKINKKTGTESVKKDRFEDDLHKRKIETFFSNILSDKKLVRNTIIIIIIFFVLYMISTKKTNNQDKEEKIIIENNNIEKKSQNEVMSESQDSTTSKFNTTNLQTLIKKEDTIKLSLIGLETTWVRVKVDDQNTYDIYLKPQEEKSWKAKQKFELRVGNAGGIKVKLNDKEIPPLGKRGEVLDKVVLPQKTK